MNIYIVMADWGSGGQVEGCYMLEEDARDRLDEVVHSADWAVIEEHLVTA